MGHGRPYLLKNLVIDKISNEWFLSVSFLVILMVGVTCDDIDNTLANLHTDCFRAVSLSAL